MAALHTAQPGTENVDGYGLGWSFSESHGLDLVEHGGALVTWTSHMAVVRGEDGRLTGDAAIVLTDTIGAPGLLARVLAADAAGQNADMPERSVLTPAIVFGAGILLVALAGLIGLLRSRTWPTRRRRSVPRVLGLGWLVALAVFCILAPALLASAGFGSSLGVLTAWHFGAGMLPEAIVLIAWTALVALAVIAARLVSLRSRTG